MHATWTEESPGSAFDLRLAQAMRRARGGAILLIEMAPRWPLQVTWLERVIAQLEPRGMLHDAGDAVLAIIAPEVPANEAWLLMEHLRERAEAAHMHLLVGMATWPVQGSTPVEVVAAAAAALLDEHARLNAAADDELKIDFDGRDIVMGAVGELLTG